MTMKHGHTIGSYHASPAFSSSIFFWGMNPASAGRPCRMRPRALRFRNFRFRRRSSGSASVSAESGPSLVACGVDCPEEISERSVVSLRSRLVMTPAAPTTPTMHMMPRNTYHAANYESICTLLRITHEHDHYEIVRCM